MTATDVTFRPGWRTWIRFTLSMARATAWYALHPKAPLPGDCGYVTMSVRVPRSASGTQLAALAEVADGLKVRKRPAPLDCMTARRHFGRVSVMATVQGPNYTAELARRTPPAWAGAEAAEAAA